MDFTIVQTQILDEVFRRHPEIADCEAHRAILCEFADDGVNFSADSWEKVLLEKLVATGAILTRPTAEMKAEEEYQRAKAARALRHAENDYKRALAHPDVSRKEGWAEWRRLKAEEDAAKAEERKALESLSPEQLRAKIQADEAAKGLSEFDHLGRPREQRKGIPELPWTYKLRYSNETITLDSRGLARLIKNDSDEYAHLRRVYGIDMINKALRERTATTAA